MKRRALNNVHIELPWPSKELSHRLDQCIFSVRPRVAELHKQGKIRATGERRKSDNGKSSHVWCIA